MTRALWKPAGGRQHCLRSQSIFCRAVLQALLLPRAIWEECFSVGGCGQPWRLRWPSSLVVNLVVCEVTGAKSRPKSPVSARGGLAKPGFQSQTHHPFPLPGVRVARRCWVLGEGFPHCFVHGPAPFCLHNLPLQMQNPFICLPSPVQGPI